MIKVLKSTRKKIRKMLKPQKLIKVAIIIASLSLLFGSFLPLFFK